MPIRRSFVCTKGSRTEGEYANSDAFEKLEKKKLLVCECCGSTKVTVELAAPRINNGATKSKPQTENYWLARCDPHAPHENVGNDFIEATRAMHEGKAPVRNLVGKAKDRDARALAREFRRHYEGRASKYDA